MPKAKLEKSWVVARKSWNLIWENRKFFAIVLGFYALAYIIAVESTTTLASVSSTLNHYRSLYPGAVGGLWSGISTYGSLISSLAGSNSPSGGGYQIILFTSLSLVIIWSIKHLMSKKKISVRDAFYLSSTPLIPFFLIVLFIGFELIPLLIAASLYNNVVVGGIAVNAFESIIFTILFILLGCVSLYFITSSLLALYLVTDNNVRPMAALKQAKALVKKRRMLVFSKIIFLPIALFIAIGIIMLPFIWIVPGIAQWVLFLLLLIAIALSHSYMYNLSQELKR
jgi:hypothetical protein